VATQNTWQITDYSNEKSSFALTSVTVNAGNLAAQQTLAAALTDAVDDLTIGNLSKQTQALIIVDSPGAATNIYAQRELKWLVSYQAVTSGKIFQTEIAAPDLTDNVVTNSDVADLTSTDWAAFVTAFVSYVKSPDDPTDSVIVLGARLVGRNI